MTVAVGTSLVQRRVACFAAHAGAVELDLQQLAAFTVAAVAGSVLAG